MAHLLLDAGSEKPFFFACDYIQMGGKKSLSWATKHCESGGYCENPHVLWICLEV